jgi:hypothetical protein
METEYETQEAASGLVVVDIWIGVGRGGEFQTKQNTFTCNLTFLLALCNGTEQLLF